VGASRFRLAGALALAGALPAALPLAGALPAALVLAGGPGRAPRRGLRPGLDRGPRRGSARLLGRDHPRARAPRPAPPPRRRGPGPAGPGAGEGAPPAGPLFAPTAAPGDPRALDARLVAGADLGALLLAATEVASLEVEERSLLQRRLAALVRLEPGTADGLAAAALAAPPGHDAEDLLIGALGAAGTPAAERALLEVGRARRGEPRSLVSLLPALGQLATPSPAGAEFLRALRRDPETGPEARDTALLALGAVARHAAHGEPALAARLVDEVTRAVETERTELALLALGNTGAPEAAGLLERHLAAGRPAAARAAATAALGGLPGERAAALLELALADADPRVRAEAALAWATRPHRGAVTGRLLAQAADDPDPRARSAALPALARAAAGPGPDRPPAGPRRRPRRAGPPPRRAAPRPGGRRLVARTRPPPAGALG